MSTTKPVSVKELKLDLKNFRTVPQRSEANALHAMISIAPDRFWALTESLLDGGYLPTENIIVLKGGKDDQEMIVKEGNRRVGALKLILGDISTQGLSIPENIEAKIKNAPNDWKTGNASVPCAIYSSSEAVRVDKIVTLAHGKGDKASRDNWTSVARARHNRDKNKASEPALDLLEKYLKGGENLTQQQKERWGGDYPLTVLVDALNRTAPRLGFETSRELANAYPNIKLKVELENLLLDIGEGRFVFKDIHNFSSHI